MGNHYMTEHAQPEWCDDASMGAVWRHAIKCENTSIENYIWGDLLVKQYHDDSLPRSGMDWPIHPEGFTKLLAWIHQRYRPQGGIIVTENGYGDTESSQGETTSDMGRIEYIH